MNYTSLKELIEIDSPTGFTHIAAEYCFNYLKNLGFNPTYTIKGAVKCSLGENPTLCIAGHLDTLGAIISSINGDGTLSISLLGGLSMNMAEGEYCRIHTHEGRIYTGTLLLNNPSAHANKDLDSTKRNIESMHIRLDELVENKNDVLKLGIQVGDIIAFDTRYQELESGFIKSRYLDNKAGCFVLFEIAERAKKMGKPIPVELFFSNYEEVGHGASGGFAPTIKDMLVIDMGVVGHNVEGKETACSICAKDSTGPYDYNFRKELVELCRKNNIPYHVDIYPFYGSDGSAALRAGNQFRVALIGMGVAASHGVERTHKKGIEATLDLCMAYIEGLANILA
ncbi:MAG: M42 family metallopeptidase [Bacteroidetes bacterium]|jgi:putative aminopeptidase FrvX|nr:M42 family metallopeptidase [Bacteroidota bacterium]